MISAMKRRQLSLIILLAIGVILGVTWRRWLPWLLIQLDFIEANSSLLEGLSALVDLIVWGGNAVIVYFLWISRAKKQDGKADISQQAPLEAITVEQLLAEQGKWGGRIHWVDRQSTKPSDLKSHKRVAIIGRRKLGKTREAIALIQQAIDDDLVTADHIYVPGRALIQLEAEEIRDGVVNLVPHRVNTLLFIDDLPYFYIGDGLDKLQMLIDSLSGHCRDVYLLATVRQDQWLDAHRDWLRKLYFLHHELQPLAVEHVRELVALALQLFEIEGGATARKLFIEANDGTPERVLSIFRQLHANGVKRLEDAPVQEMLAQELSVTWAAIRTEAKKAQPASPFFFQALGAFQAAGFTPYTELVLAFAIQQWTKETEHPYRWQMRSALQKTLDHLAAHHDFVSDGEVIAFPDIAVEGLGADETTQEQLSSFLVSTREKFSCRKLYFWLLFSWADIRYSGTGSIHGYTQAINTLPHADAYFSRGVRYSHQNNYDLAIRDYSRAIELNPEYAYAYNNRGNTYLILEQHEAALADYGRAIDLNPEYAAAYNNRGNTYRDLGQHKAALADYGRAIDLNPEYAAAYNNRGLTYRDLGQHEAALADYERAIDLNPEDAAAYYNERVAKIEGWGSDFS